MPLPALPNTGIVRPNPGADRDTWGGITNVAWEDIDELFAPDGSGPGMGFHVGPGKILKIDGTVNLAPSATLPGGSIADGSVPLTKIENINSDRLIGRAATGAGPPEQIICTPQARNLLDDVDAAEMRATLGAASSSGNTFTSDQVVQSLDAGASAGPLVVLDRASPSPAIDDQIGALEFRGRNDAPATRAYAAVGAKIADMVAGSEDGVLQLATMIAGVLAPRMALGQGMYAPGLTDKGPGTINVAGLYIAGSLAGFPRGHIDGFILSNDSGDAANDIGISAGQATASDGDYMLETTSNITKRLDAAWAVGSDQGGLDTGSKANDTWYHVWVIARPDTGVVDVLFSTSATAPTMPANYTKKRRVGSVRTDGSGNILAFRQIGNEFEWAEPAKDADLTDPGTASVDRALTVPLGVSVMARITPALFQGGSDTPLMVAEFRSKFTNNSPVQSIGSASLASPGSIAVAENGGQWAFGGDMWIMTDTARQIKFRLSQSYSASHVGILTRGWRDFRGRQ